MPEVSVVIPFHNRVKWLSEAIRSLLDQIYTDFEIIAVDDGSTEELPSQMMEDSRIRYARQEKKGASAARKGPLEENVKLGQSLRRTGQRARPVAVAGEPEHGEQLQKLERAGCVRECEG